jgi:hypothetical protein
VAENQYKCEGKEFRYTGDGGVIFKVECGILIKFMGNLT